MSVTKREAFKVLYEPDDGWRNEEHVDRVFAAFNHGESPHEKCAACGIPSEGSTCCVGCGFGWDDIAKAVKIVDKVGAALGVDTGTVGEATIRSAIDAALGEIVDMNIDEPTEEARARRGFGV